MNSFEHQALSTTETPRVKKDQRDATGTIDVNYRVLDFSLSFLFLSIYLLQINRLIKSVLWNLACNVIRTFIQVETALTYQIFTWAHSHLVLLILTDSCFSNKINSNSKFS